MKIQFRWLDEDEWPAAALSLEHDGVIVESFAQVSRVARLEGASSEAALMLDAIRLCVDQLGREWEKSVAERASA